MHDTVVGGFAHAEELEFQGKTLDGAELTLLSARPEGPRHSLLSLLMVASQKLLAPLDGSACSGKYAPTCGEKWGGSPMTKGIVHYNQSSMFLSVSAKSSASALKLPCVWMPNVGGTPGAGFMPRLSCGIENWGALDAIRLGRMHAKLTLRLAAPFRLSATIPFVVEGMNGLPKPARTSACIDVAYHEGNDPVAFHMWTIAMQLVGFDRVYVPKQRYYRHQYDMAVKAQRGMVVFGHDTVHRYLTRQQHKVEVPTTFDEVILGLNVMVATCLHERWYDEWVFLSMSVDEYFTFVHPDDPSKLPKQPTVPTPLVGEYMDRWQLYFTPNISKLPLDALGRRWPCSSAACTQVRLYSEPNRTESFGYEDPRRNASQRVHQRIKIVEDSNSTNLARTPLSIETRTQRWPYPPPHGAARKCFYHPDWRAMSGTIKIHGFTPDGCPASGWLKKTKACSLATRLELKPFCWELCGYWGSSRREGLPFTRPTMINHSTDACGYIIPNDRYDIRVARKHHGPPSEHLPACPAGSAKTCTGPEMERAHMRAGAGGEYMPWLSILGGTVRTELAADALKLEQKMGKAE